MILRSPEQIPGNFVLWYPVDHSGTSQDPKLVIEHTAAGTSGNNDGTYGPLVENGDFRKYEYIDDTYWKVTDKFGTVYTFGEASTTRQHKDGEATTTFKWMLEEVRDLNDNYRHYEYYQDNGQIYPSKITYTGSGSTPGIFELHFIRSYNPDIATTTSTGFPVKTYYKISQVQVTANGQLVRQYDLSYGNGFKNINLLLSSITELGVDEMGATTTLPAYTFDYNPGFSPTWTLDPNFATSSMDFFVASGSAAGDGIWKDLGIRMVDVNGDGYADQIHATYTNRWVNLNNTEEGWIGQAQVVVPEDFLFPFSYEDFGLRILDANGDGLADLVRSDPGTTATYLNTGTGSWTPASYSIGPPFPPLLGT